MTSSASSDKFCLKWNEFQLNIETSYHNLRKHSDFSDVTLVCDDNHRIEAHRIILTACSPFFNSVLKKNEHSHPLIYMRGLKAKDLDAIVDFIYHGEASIYQDDLDAFLSLAEEFKLKGLAPSEDQSPGHKVDVNQKPILRKSQRKQFVQREKELYTPSEESKPLQDDSFTEYQSHVPDKIGKVIMAVDENTEDIESLMERISDGDNNWKCAVCGKKTKGSPAQMKRHVEVHLDGLSYPCTECGKVSRSAYGLKQHMSSNHPPDYTGKVIMGVDGNTEEIESLMERISDGDNNWKCAVCGKKTKGSPAQMKRHVEVHLEGLSYPCTECGKFSRSSYGLKQHIASNHRKYLGSI